MHITEYQASLVPHEFPEAGRIANSLINFLKLGFRNYPTLIERVDHFAFYVSDESIMSTHRFRQRFLFNTLVTLCGCCRPRLKSGVDPQYLISASNGAKLNKDFFFTQRSQGSLKLSQRFLHVLITTNEKRTMKE